MNASQILARKGNDIISAESGMKTSDVVALLAERRIGAVPIMKDGQLVGMLSERDIMRGIAISGAKILDDSVDGLMTKSVHSCAPDDSVDALLAVMTDRKIRHLPVLDGGKMVGMISIGDVVKEKISESEREAEALKHYIASA